MRSLARVLIADAMTQLSTEHRAVIERSYYRGWTTAQIAADLEIAEGTVKSRINRGRMELARLLSRNKKQASHE